MHPRSQQKQGPVERQDRPLVILSEPYSQSRRISPREYMRMYQGIDVPYLDPQSRSLEQATVTVSVYINANSGPLMKRSSTCDRCTIEPGRMAIRSPTRQTHIGRRGAIAEWAVAPRRVPHLLVVCAVCWPNNNCRRAKLLRHPSPGT